LPDLPLIPGDLADRPQREEPGPLEDQALIMPVTKGWDSVQTFTVPPWLPGSERPWP